MFVIKIKKVSYLLPSHHLFFLAIDSYIFKISNLLFFINYKYSIVSSLIYSLREKKEEENDVERSIL